MIRFWVWVLCLPGLLWAQADDSRWMKHEAYLAPIAQHAMWQHLLTYSAKNEGQAQNDAFYLSPVGRTNPYQELLATLEAFATPVLSEGEHPQCRYPARRLWLSRQISLSAFNIGMVNCDRFKAFSGGEQARSVSLMFASGYLGNPASYYGHLLFRINGAEGAAGKALKDTTINFGAQIPDDENMAVYIGKGLFGGYRATYTNQEYFKHEMTYGETENRDIWEYELALSDEDRDLLIAYAWELKSAQFTYYFTNRNCAYYMGRMVELISGKGLVYDKAPWSVPQSLVQNLQLLEYQGGSIVKAVRYHPSRQSRLYGRYGSLKAEDKRFVHAAVANPDMIDQEIFSTRPLMRQHQILDTLMDYYQYVGDPIKDPEDPYKAQYNQVLSKRYQLPAGIVEPHYDSDANPHLGRRPSYVSAGLAHHPSTGTDLVMRFRPVYYDSLDAGYGHIKNAVLSMGEVTLGMDDEGAYLKELNLVKIDSLRRNFTGLPGDRQHAWSLEAGARQLPGHDDYLVANLSGTYGLSRTSLNENLLLAGLAGVGYWGDRLDIDGVHGLIRGSANLSLGRDWQLRFGVEHREFLSGENLTETRFDLRWAIGQQWDTRLSLVHEEDIEIGLSIGRYW